MNNFVVTGPIFLSQIVDLDELLVVSNGGGALIFEEVFVPSSDDFALQLDVTPPDTTGGTALDLQVTISVMKIYDSTAPAVVHDYYGGSAGGCLCDGNLHSFNFNTAGTSARSWMNDDGTIVTADSGIYIAIVNLTAMLD